MTGFTEVGDQELAVELATVWVERKYIAGSLIDVDHLVAGVDAVLRGGATLSMPSVTVAPRPGVLPSPKEHA
ncbi:MAG TPA: hypothetical protein VK611_02700 [Acidimicrobiales bacterium]|nr:hypothetical protein [Acidimicrobiales bacterium]